MAVNLFTLILIIFTLISGILWSYIKIISNIRRFKYNKIINTTKNKDINKNNTSRKINFLFKSAKSIASFFPVLAMILTVRSFVYEPFQIPSGSMMPTLLIGDFILVKKFAYGIKDPLYGKTLISTSHPKRGDIIVFKYPKNPHFNYIKRTIGLPGDKILYNPITKKISIYPASDSGVISNKLLPIKYSSIKPSFFLQNINYSQNNEPLFSFSQEFSEEKQYNNYIRMMERTEKLGNLTSRILIVPIFQDQVHIYYHQDYQQFATWTVPPGHYFVMGDNRDNSYDSRYWGFVPESNLIGKAIMIWMSVNKHKNKLPIGIRINRIGWLN